MDELIKLRDRAYDEAEVRYRKCHNADHGRFRPLADYDHDGMVLWGRLWLVCLVQIEIIEGMDPGSPPVEEMLNHAYNANHSDVLEGMYG